MQAKLARKAERARVRAERRHRCLVELAHTARVKCGPGVATRYEPRCRKQGDWHNPHHQVMCRIKVGRCLQSKAFSFDFEDEEDGASDKRFIWLVRGMSERAASWGDAAVQGKQSVE